MVYDILCVCSGAQLRAPYLARYLDECYRTEGYKAESAGISPVGERNLVTQEMIDTAHVVVSVHPDIADSLRERDFNLQGVLLIELKVQDQNPPFRDEQVVYEDLVSQIDPHLSEIKEHLETVLQQS